MDLLPWQPAPDLPESLYGLWMQHSAAVSYPGYPGKLQKLCAPAGLSRNHHGPIPPKQKTSKVGEVMRKHLHVKTICGV